MATPKTATLHNSNKSHRSVMLGPKGAQRDFNMAGTANPVEGAKASVELTGAYAADALKRRGELLKHNIEVIAA